MTLSRSFHIKKATVTLLSDTMGGSGGKYKYEKVDLTGKTAIVTGANSGEFI